jgi:DNA-binding transcriptional LysR family regulator
MDRVTSMTAFTTVVASGSFAAAAKRLGMSPAMVTNHVKSLEERLGARLLNRTTRKLSLTEAGQDYHESCAQILSEIEDAESRIAALNSTPRGTLRVNTSTVLSHGLVALIGEFGAAYPEITVELVATDRMVDLVEEGVDVAIRFNEAPDSSLIVRRLGQFRVVACASPSYLEKRGVPRQPSDLAGHNCLAYMHPGFTTLTREWHFIGLEGEVTVPVSGNLHSNYPEAIRAAAIEGRGIAMSQTYFVEEAIRSGKLACVLPDYHLGEFPIFAIYPHRQYVPAKLRCFIDLAVKHFAEHPKWQLPASAPCAPLPRVARRAG